MAFFSALESNKNREEEKAQADSPLADSLLKDTRVSTTSSLSMDHGLGEQRKSYRRSSDRRRGSDRRGKWERRCRSHAKSAPASRITLSSITLRSLAKADPAVVAVELVKLKVVDSVEAARRLVAKTPAPLARYLAEKTASAVGFSLRTTGADVVWQTDRVTCPHCCCAVPCEGEATSSRHGVTFGCPECDGLTLLDARDRKFHPLLRCSVCGALLNLPAEPRPGKYRCKCGQTLAYQPAQDRVAFVVAEELANPGFASAYRKPRNPRSA